MLYVALVAYKDLQTRKETREAAWTRPGWDECVAYTGTVCCMLLTLTVCVGIDTSFVCIVIILCVVIDMSFVCIDT